MGIVLIKIKKTVEYIFSQSMIMPWMLVVSLLPMIFSSIFAYDLAYDAFNFTIHETLLTAVQKKVETIDQYINERKLDIKQISKLPRLQTLIDKMERGQASKESLDVKLFANYLSYLLPKMGVKDIYIANSQGKIIFSLFNKNLVDITLTAQDLKNLPLFRSFDGARILRIPYLFASYQQGKDSSTHIYISNIIETDTPFKAILIMELDLRDIKRIVERQLGYGKTENTILAAKIDNSVAIVMDTAIKYENYSQLALSPEVTNLLAQAIRGKIADPIEFFYQHIARVAVYSYVPQLNMGMAITYEKKEVFEKIHALRIQMLILISVSILLVALLASWIARALWKAQAKTADLLENILPKFVIEELKEKKQFLPRNVNDVSIVFIDITNFTPFTSKHTPEAVVRILDEIFSLFDKLCEKYHMEKIKTIGDAYMAVAGLISAHKEHANNATNFGIEAILAVKHYDLDHNLGLSVRVGIDSGVVTSGIIGQKKFSYDLWGNAVNRASRMESTGVPDKVKITEETYAALLRKEHYKITPCEITEIKGLGKLKSYLIEIKINIET
ncbi:MAG: PAS fold family [uncultured bacterium]|nr:MAG: PAS fold family [uncultured bacterium]OGT15290.1 MAG: hypothetical protein A3B69_04210 [Gammaproteobacteria bacterium RIFCSPHIGHO2_02_FULL_38_33]OGT76647.1 MAG: hypothetical protein A3G71_02570 [Gammaproteobacteria bacterium RIFCSPLOWO2_12_FULL_38_14]